MEICTNYIHGDYEEFWQWIMEKGVNLTTKSSDHMLIKEPQFDLFGTFIFTSENNAFFIKKSHICTSIMNGKWKKFCRDSICKTFS